MTIENVYAFCFHLLERFVYIVDWSRRIDEKWVFWSNQEEKNLLKM